VSQLRQEVPSQNTPLRSNPPPTQVQAHVIACSKFKPNAIEDENEGQMQRNEGQMQPKQKKEVLVPSRNEEVVLNYKLEDYYYIKVLLPLPRSPSTTASRVSSGRKRR
jgi:hypothetical protein